MVSLTIDGKTIQVPEGTTVLRAAEMASVEIPTLCHHPKLVPYGGCRLCLVEVEGARVLQPSCTLPVNNNMVVHTNTARVQEARKFVLTLIFSERNHFCPYCVVSGGDCELQNSAYKQDMTHWPLQPNWQQYPIDASHPYYVLDNNRCILCRRCVRACNELVGNNTLGFEERGAKSLLIADYGVPLGESSCVSCGTCIQVCPTGALIDRKSAFLGHDVEIVSTHSICTGCSVGCSTIVQTRDNQLVRVEGNWDAPVNEGLLCKYGRFESIEDQRERLHSPMIRKNGKLTPVAWEEAYALIAEKLNPIKGKKQNGVAALISSRQPVEALSAFRQLFADGMGSENVSSIEEGYATASAARLADELGKPYEGNFDSIKAADCVIIVGSDLGNEHPVAGFYMKRRTPGDLKMIVIDANENPFDLIADYALKPKKGKELDLVQGLERSAVRLGLSRTDAKMTVDETCDDLAKKAGVDSQVLLEVAGMMAIAKKPVVIFGKVQADAEGSYKLIKALYELVGLLQGDASMISIKGLSNSHAASLLRLDKPVNMEEAQVAFVVTGDNKMTDGLVQRVEKVPFKVILSSYVSPLSAVADVVLPVTTWPEQEGHYVNFEGRVQAAKRSLVAPKDVVNSLTSLRLLAVKLGLSLKEDWSKELQQRVGTIALVDVD